MHNLGHNARKNVASALSKVVAGGETPRCYGYHHATIDERASRQRHKYCIYVRLPSINRSSDNRTRIRFLKFEVRGIGDHEIIETRNALIEQLWRKGACRL